MALYSRPNTSRPKTTRPQAIPTLHVATARVSAVVAVAVLSWASAATGAVTPDKLRQADAQYRVERAACLEGKSSQDRQSCLAEASAALAAAKSGKLDTGESQEVLMRNALARCAAVPQADRVDCERLARGEGEQSGSVNGGGVLKKIVTRSVAPIVPAQPKP